MVLLFSKDEFVLISFVFFGDFGKYEYWGVLLLLDVLSVCCVSSVVSDWTEKLSYVS